MAAMNASNSIVSLASSPLNAKEIRLRRPPPACMERSAQ
jgi:hypothetical protein